MVVEIFLPRIAVRIEGWIDSLPTKAPIFFYSKFFYTTNGLVISISPLLDQPYFKDLAKKLDFKQMTPGLIVIVTIINFLICLLWFGICVALSYLSYGLWGKNPQGNAFMLIFVILGIGASVVLGGYLLLAVVGISISLICVAVVNSIKTIVELLNGLTKGHAIGAIGFIIAVIGFAMKFI